MNSRPVLGSHGLVKFIAASLNSNTIYIFASLLFALAFQLPGWPDIFREIYGYPMIDRSVYERLIITDNLAIDYIQYFELLMYFTYEWTWHSLVSYLYRNIGLTTDEIFFLITTIILWRFSFDVISRAGWLYLPFLVNPLVVDFAFSQLRLALAIALISTVWRGQRGVAMTISIYVLAATVHTSIVIFAAMHMAAHIFRKNNTFNLASLIGTGASVSIAVGPLREKILSPLNDRRIEYQDMSSSFSYLSFWLLLLLALLAISIFRKQRMTIETRYSVVVLSIAAVNILTGGYSTRFIAASIPSLITSVKDTGREFSVQISIALLLYTIVLWLYWFRMLG